jgi:hypothetical protein
MHDVEDVVGQFAAGPVRPAVSERVGHVGDADTPAHIGAVCERYLFPLARLRPPYPDRTAKRVGVWNAVQPLT